MKGQALISLLFFTIVTVTIASAAVVINLVNALGTSTFQQGELAFYTAETGAENALLRLLRDPNYSGETLTVAEGSATVIVSGTGEKTIVSKGRVGNFQRTIQVNVQLANNTLSVLSWKEIF